VPLSATTGVLCFGTTPCLTTGPMYLTVVSIDFKNLIYTFKNEPIEFANSYTTNHCACYSAKYQQIAITIHHAYDFLTKYINTFIFKHLAILK
jgi:hypothetical protein